MRDDAFGDLVNRISRCVGIARVTAQRPRLLGVRQHATPVRLRHRNVGGPPRRLTLMLLSVSLVCLTPCSVSRTRSSSPASCGATMPETLPSNFWPVDQSV